MVPFEETLEVIQPALQFPSSDPVAVVFTRYFLRAHKRSEMELARIIIRGIRTRASAFSRRAARVNVRVLAGLDSVSLCALVLPKMATSLLQWRVKPIWTAQVQHCCGPARQNRLSIAVII